MTFITLLSLYSTGTVFNNLEPFFTYLASSGMKKPATAKGVFFTYFLRKKYETLNAIERNLNVIERNLSGLDFGERFCMENKVHITIFNDSEQS